MLMAFGQTGSGYRGDGHDIGAGGLRAFVKIVARGFSSDLDQIAMDTVDVTAEVDERELSGGKAADGSMTFDHRNARYVAPGGNDTAHERGNGDERIVNAGFGCSDILPEACGGGFDLVGHDFSSSGSGARSGDGRRQGKGISE
jgi:hypothetical protein